MLEEDSHVYVQNIIQFSKVALIVAGSILQHGYE